jgi:hypothetical protein
MVDTSLYCSLLVATLALLLGSSYNSLASLLPYMRGVDTPLFIFVGESWIIVVWPIQTKHYNSIKLHTNLTPRNFQWVF